jgi:hypothetical protein
MARAAKVGDRWVKIDRQTLAKVRALQEPAADRAKITRLEHLADVAINKGIAGLVAAAKSGSKSRYNAAAVRAGKLIKPLHNGAVAYGFKVCTKTWS